MTLRASQAYREYLSHRWTNRNRNDRRDALQAYILWASRQSCLVYDGNAMDGDINALFRLAANAQRCYFIK